MRTRTIPTWFCLVLWLGAAHPCRLLASPQTEAGNAATHFPLIQKIEPPNWWLGLPDPMLLISGRNLTGARVTTETPGVEIARVSPSRNGDYLFVWLQIGDLAQPGKIQMSVKTAAASTSLEIPLLERNPAAQQAEANAGFNGFSSDDVIYLIMPDRFADGDPGNNFPDSGAYNRSQPRAYHGGDLRGIQQRLPYLKDLGITTIWITPVYQNDDSTGRDYHGYGATDLFAVEKHLGTLDDYRSLVTAAHRQNLKMLLDIVPNHVGPANSWVNDPPSDRWLHGSLQQHLVIPMSFVPETDPHLLPEQWRDVTEGWFGGVLPDMGTDDSVAAQYLRQNAIWWAETGALDGFRIDTFPYVDRHFWHDFHQQIHQVFPRFRTVGEVFNTDPTVTSYFVGGRKTEGIDTGVDTVFDFPLFHAIRDVVLKDAPATELEDVLRHDWMFPHPENLVTFLGNHDTTRFMGEPGATPQKLELAFSLLLTMRGIPQIYSGDEIGMPGGGDPDNRRDFPGGFPGDTQDAFREQGRTREQQEIFNHVHGLLQARQSYAALRAGRQVTLLNDVQTYAYERCLDSPPVDHAPQCLLMIMNNADRTRTLELAVQDTPLANARALQPLLGARPVERDGHLNFRVAVGPRTLNVYVVQ